MCKRIIVFEINHTRMDGYVFGIPVCALYFILGGVFVILGKVPLNKCVLCKTVFNQTYSPYWFLTRLTCCWNSLNYSINFFEWYFCDTIVYNSHLFFNENVNIFPYRISRDSNLSRCRWILKICQDFQGKAFL